MFNIIFENNTDFNIDLEFVNKIATHLKIGEIELILTTNEEMQEINLTTRGLDKPTDVLSFPYLEMPNSPIGSIVISLDFLKEYSKEYENTIEEEFILLFIHGVLHILGYDHEIDNGEHREKEKELIEFFNLPQSLIVRNS
ncbi:MAG: rRNA maturation RNase YbeY [Arcobacteraceae bacterium]|nr:rRNA maturation RNase YbeY [Arcobacteraceae bacterium]